MQMIIAGTDTSSVTMFYLLQACQDDPDLEKGLTLEVDKATGRPLITSRLKVSNRIMIAAPQWHSTLLKH